MARATLIQKTRLFSTATGRTTGKHESTKKATNDGGFFSKAWSGYMKSLKKHPLLTKGSTATLIFFFSDLGTQYISYDYTYRRAFLAQQRILSENPEDEEISATESLFAFDFHRAMNGAVFGLVGTTYLHYFWGFLEKAVELRIPAKRYRLPNTLTKVFIDQVFSAPLYIYVYYFITSILKKDLVVKNSGKAKITDRITSAHERTSELLLPTMLKHWRLWPAVHTINFHFFPLQHRVLFQNVVLVGWSGYLSHLNHSAEKTSLKSSLRRRESSNIGLDVVQENIPESKTTAIMKTKTILSSRATVTAEVA